MDFPSMPRNMKITHKLSIVLGIVLIGFVAIGAAYKYVLVINEQSAATIAQLSKFGNYIEGTRLGLLEAQRVEKDFTISQDIELVKQFEFMMASSEENLTELEAVAPEGLDRNLLRNVHNLFRRYHSDFYGVAEAQMALGIDHETGLQGELREAVHEVEAELKKANDTTLTASMLQLRRHEKDFILRGLDEYVTKIGKEKTHFDALLKKSDLPAAVKSKIAKLMDEYQKRFQDFVDAAQERKLAGTATQSTANLLRPLFVSLIEAKDELLAANTARIDEEQQTATTLFTLILIITGGLVATILLSFARSLIRSLKTLHSAVTKVADGDFTARAELGTEDELGAVGSAFDNLLDERLTQMSQAEEENDRLNDSVIELLEAVSDLSERDLRVQVPVKEDITGPVADAMNQMTTETARVLSEIRQVSDEVELVANTVKQQGDKVTDVAASEREVVDLTMSKLDAASKAMTEVAGLAQSCKEIAARASDSTKIAFDTVSGTADGMNDIRETISETEKRIKRLGERSQEITTIVDIIKDIAERTHGLALNASMQAAAAGDAGRGFAVVADEVQRLAESSRNSTAQITSLVRGIQREMSETMSTMNKAIGQVVEGTGLAERAGQEMQTTQTTTAELVSAVVKIAENSLSQTRVHDELRNDAEVIRKSTQDTGRELLEQTEHTENLVNYAIRLRDAVHVFKLPDSMHTTAELIPLRKEQGVGS